EAAVRALLASAPASTNALAALLGREPVWRPGPQETAAPSPARPEALSAAASSVQDLLRRHPESLHALVAALAAGGGGAPAGPRRGGGRIPGGPPAGAGPPPVPGRTPRPVRQTRRPRQRGRSGCRSC